MRRVYETQTSPSSSNEPNFYWDDFWGVAGLRAGAELLRAVDQPDAAGADRFAAGMWEDLERSSELTAERLGTIAIPAGPRRWIDSGAIGSLVACVPLELLSADDPRIAATADVIRQRFTLADGRAFFQGISHTALGTYLTLQLAAVELRAGNRQALDRLGWMLDAATPTWTWPEAIHPRLDGGCMGDGHHGRAAAELLTFVRHLLVREVTGGLALASLVPDAWYGRGWEVHDAPTASGHVSHAVRWHGDRAALLWEVSPHPGVDHVRLTAPGLDLVVDTERRGRRCSARSRRRRWRQPPRWDTRLAATHRRRAGGRSSRQGGTGSASIPCGFRSCSSARTTRSWA